MLYVMKDTVSSTLLPNSAAPPAQLTISIYQHIMHDNVGLCVAIKA